MTRAALAQPQIDEIEQEVGLPIGTKYQPGNGEGQQQTRGVPYSPVRLKTARQRCRAVRIGGSWVGLWFCAHTRMLARFKPAVAYPAIHRSAILARP